MRVAFITVLLSVFCFQGNLFSADGEKYALLVGVDTYREDSGLNNLKCAESDMTSLAAALKDIGFKDDNVHLMIQSGAGSDRLKPRRENILKQLELMLNFKRREDMVIVAFCGHGVQFRGDDKPFFCCSDAKVADKDTLLDLNSVLDQLKDCEAAKKLLIADCCRDDPLFKATRGVPSSVTRFTRIKPPQSVATLFSCSEGQSAFEDADKLKGGVFTHFLVQGLHGAAAHDGIVDVAGLGSYVQRAVYDHVANRFGAAQRPYFLLENNEPIVLGKVEDPKELMLDIGGGQSIQFVRVEAGEFTMGADAGDLLAFDNEKPAHNVHITKAFYVGKFPVTIAQFRQFVTDTGYKTDAEKPDAQGLTGGYSLQNNQYVRIPTANWQTLPFRQDDNHPAVCVTWNDTQAFIKWMKTKTNTELRLPTEAEFEYAARGPHNNPYPWGLTFDGTLCNHADSSLEKTAMSEANTEYSSLNDGYAFTSPVGAFQNASWCGAFDMSGNVWNLCEDWMGDYSAQAQTNPTGALTGTQRVIKGGSWHFPPKYCRSSARFSIPQDYAGDNTSFRLVLTK
ncbi:MAG TPA: SUMF1/EgtB/PvdO family nonheme iron enzyme [Planctomycetota bacterium]|nr:SUMF1/EgtB/PvdO family nonheme iron enzyme [Planctomycetota bacterium]